ncbi:hypothetical protein OCA42_24510 [Bacillus cereus]|uniref:dual OB domain-containing protein n=1 Tax=Bacillus TaxID=1386 RepID=UPI000C6D7AA3|nr:MULTISPECIES: hypothetical protein [Bacillus]KAA1804763.1 hypothetical protein FXB61_004381 [Bacillus cereus]MCU5320197.1 hypothetical protein [Bacillus cereus]MCU5573011.1 hypothetical protein [Bacillus cereus]PKS13564.1 hypothetical protein CX118_28755 [Bacillus sp. BI3]HDR7805743.1 hypothetical protein [Bacillus cereus]
MKVCILAVTEAYDGYCIAGMTDNGVWVRPIPSNQGTRFWTTNQLTSAKHGFLRVGDVLEFDGQQPQKFQHPNHTEDFEVSGKMKLCKRLSNKELIDFLQDKEEPQQAFQDTVNARGRSLCLVKVDGFKHTITQWQDKPKKPKMTFTKDSFNVDNPKTNYIHYIVKDCKWVPLVLNNTIDNNAVYNEIYLVLGLATKNNFDGIEYPQVIGLHTEPEVPMLDTYPN